MGDGRFALGSMGMEEMGSVMGFRNQLGLDDGGFVGVGCGWFMEDGKCWELRFGVLVLLGDGGWVLINVGLGSADWEGF